MKTCLMNVCARHGPRTCYEMKSLRKMMLFMSITLVAPYVLLCVLM